MSIDIKALKEAEIGVFMNMRFFLTWKSLYKETRKSLDKLTNPNRIIVFPENVMRNRYNPSEIEQRVCEFGDVLKDKEHLFLSMFEETDKVAKNKGYLISKKGSKLKVQAYEKYWYTLLDFQNTEVAHIYNERKRVIYGAETRFDGGLGMDIEKKYGFPTIEIGDKKIDFRVCRDILLDNKESTDISVVSGFGFPDKDDKKINTNNITLIDCCMNPKFYYNNKRTVSFEDVNEIFRQGLGIDTNIGFFRVNYNLYMIKKLIQYDTYINKTRDLMPKINMERINKAIEDLK